MTLGVSFLLMLLSHSTSSHAGLQIYTCMLSCAKPEFQRRGEGGEGV